MATRMLTVKNRSDSKVIYKIPEDNIRREFAPREVKMISYDELAKLSFQPGGREMMIQYLQITDERALNSVGIKPQPEYYMTEQQIIELLQRGSLDAFLDCLDYAPAGIIDLIKKYAVSLPLNDYEKRQALKKKTGFNVDKAIQDAELIKEDQAALAKGNTAPADEKASQSEVPSAPAGRRTNVNYKIVDEKK